MIYGSLSVFLINLHVYGAPLAQRAFYLALHSSLFGPDGTANYDYIVINSINFLSRCIPNGTYTNHYWANLAHAWKHIKNIWSLWLLCGVMTKFICMPEIQQYIIHVHHVHVHVVTCTCTSCTCSYMYMYIMYM